MATDDGGLTIAKPKVVLVEGKDEVEFFSKLAAHLDLSQHIQFIEMKGRAQLRNRIRFVLIAPGADIIISVGVVRDADNDPKAAFQSVCDALANAGLARPTAPLDPAGSSPQVMAIVLPDENTPGMLEDVCLRSVEDDAAMTCLEEYFGCVKARLDHLPQNPSKARVRAFLVSREVLEEGYFELLQDCAKRIPPKLPQCPSTAKVHAFLASRYKPDLDLGIAAKEGYWPLDHPAFDDVKAFLKKL